MFALGRRVAASLRASGLPCEGINFFLADGVAAGQTVLHSHLHVIPRVRGDGLGFRHGLGRGRMSRLELDELASRLGIGARLVLPCSTGVIGVQLDHRVMARAVELGCVGYLSKPFDTAELVAAVGDQVEGE